jgi:transcriptional regulator with XRE-family HTH domain
MNTLLGFPETPGFQHLLRRWRTARRLSQLQLATEAGISTRHLSFLETGRAQPSKEMVQLLAGVLDMPFNDRNMLLMSAGYAPVPVFLARPPAAPPAPELHRALQLVMRHHEPFPALVVDGDFNVVMRNDASNRIFGPFRGDADCGNVMRTVFDPRGLRPWIVNWLEVAEGAKRSIQQHFRTRGSAAMVQLRDELFAYPDIPDRWRSLEACSDVSRPVNMQLRKGDLSLTFFSTMMTFGSAPDAPHRLLIKSFFPADARTEQTARRLASRQPMAV